MADEEKGVIISWTWHAKITVQLSLTPHFSEVFERRGPDS